MKKLLTYTAIALLSISFLNAQQWFFETMFNSEGWNGIGEGENATIITVENDLLTATTDFWEGPRINHTTLENISAEVYTTLTIRMSNDPDAYSFNEDGDQLEKRLRIFWVRDDQEQYTADQLILHEYYPLEDHEDFQELEIDMTQHAGWTGMVWALRLDLCYMGGKQVDIDYIILSGESPQEYALTLTIQGEGSVEVNGNAYNEPINLTEDTDVELKAVAADGYIFDAWSGDLTSSDETVTVTMNADKNITVTFVEEPTSINEQTALNQPVKLFPNPATDVFTINNTSLTDTQVRIYAVTGSLMLSRRIGSGESAIDITGLKPGIYLVSIDNKVLKLSIR